MHVVTPVYGPKCKTARLKVDKRKVFARASAGLGASQPQWSRN